MSEEHIPCRLEVDESTGELKVIPVYRIELRPGESVTFTANPPTAIINRVWFGRRWYVAARSYLAGYRGPNLVKK